MIKLAFKMDIRKIVTTLLCGVLLFSLFSIPLSIVSAATDSVGVHQQVGDPDPDPGGGGGGGGANDVVPPQILNVQVTVQIDTVIISWTSSESASAKLNWGRNINYSDGIISAANLTISHNHELNNLQERTPYYFLITATDSSGNQSFYQGQFITGSRPDVTPPLNVSNFSAVPKQSTINLSWVNPVDSDFAFTRIVRSSTFFPLDPLNGLVVYEGSAQTFVDTNVTPGTLYSYTAFARDLTGNYSSGSLASAMIAWYSESLPGGGSGSGGNGSGNQDNIPVTDLKFIYSKDIPNIFLTQNDFNFSYDNGKTILPSNNVRLPISEFLTIKISKDKVPESTKFLMLRYKQWWYLFNDNEQTNNFELTIPNLGEVGTQNFIVSLFNNKKEIIEDVPMVVNIIEQEIFSKGLRQIVLDNFFDLKFSWYWLIIIVLILIWLIRFLWLRRKRKDKVVSHT